MALFYSKIAHFAIAYSGCFNVNVFLISKSIGSAMKS